MAEFPASLLILNGKSTDNLPLREAIMLLREEGMTIHVRITWEKGDAARFVEEARKLGVCNQVNHLIPTRVLVKGGEITCKILK